MIKNKQKALNATIYTSGGILLLMNASAGVVSAAVDSSQNRTQESSIMPTAGLADISVLSDASLISTTGNNMTPNSDGNYDLSLKYSGKGLANVGLADKKVLVYSLPSELQGKVKSGAMIDIDAQLLPIVPADVPGVNVLFTTVETAVDVFAKAVSLVGIDISGLQTAIDDLKELKELGSYQATLPGVVSADGKTISVDFTQGLGNYVNQAYAALFGGLRDAVDGINSSNTVVNTALTVLKRSTTPLFDLIDEIGAGSSTVLNSALSANILGPTSGTLRATVSDPGTPTATVRAAVINNAVLSAEIISLIDQSGEPVTLNFPNDATDPLADYQVEIPKLDPAYAGDTSISGSVVINQPVPAGTSFEAIATLGDGSEVNGTVDASGNFVINTAALTKDEVVSVKIKATNGTYTKDGSPATLTVGAKDATTNPLENYVVAAPAVNPAYAGDTSVKGSVTLTQPVPEGTTFKAIVTLPDGSEVSGDVDGSGNFTVDTGELKEADNLSVKVVATNGENTKDSAPVTVTVQAGISTENPLANYVVAAPQVEKATAGDVSIKGSVSLNQPVPVGTTFEAVVTLPDGTEKTGTIDADGKFTIDTGTLNEGDVLSVKVTAENGAYTKDSASVSITVQPAAVVTNPLENYNVSSPTVNPVTEGDTSVTGKVIFEQPIPEGTTFEAVVTLPDGTQKTGSVDANGNFTVDTGTLNADETITVKVVAHNGDNQKESTPISVTVGSKIPDTNPLADYNVSTPVVNPATAGDTSISGKVTLTEPVPAGTTFEAVVTLADGSKVTGEVDADGNFTVNTGTLKAGDVLSVKITAHNGEYSKDSAAVPVTVSEKSEVNPLDKYDVAAPKVDKIIDGDTKVTGSVDLNQPVPAGTTFEVVVTLPDGTQKSVTLGADGKFSIDTGTLTGGKYVDVQVVAHNGEFEKSGPKVSVLVDPNLPVVTNPLDNYVVSPPVVNPIVDGDTKVTGSVDLNQPIPDGTTFEVVVILPDGSEKVGMIDANGKFSIDTGKLNKDDQVKVKVVAKNGQYTKDSNVVQVTVGAKDAGNNGGGNGNGNNGNGGTGGNNGNNNGNGGTDGNNGNNNGNGGTDGNNGNNNGSGGTGGNNGNTGNNSGSGNSGSGSNSGGTGTGDGLSGGSAGGMNASNPNGGSNSGSLGTDLMQRGAVGSSPTSTATGSQAASGKSSNSGLLPKAGEKTLGVASIGAMLLAAVAVMFKKIFKRKDS